MKLFPQKKIFLCENCGVTVAVRMFHMIFNPNKV